MLPAIQINLPTARVQDAEGIVMAVAACRYQLKDAEVSVWQREDLRITEQAYDMRVRYISYMEIVVHADEAEVPIRCPYSDLYWLYVKDGQIDIVPSINGRHKIRTQMGEYRISYLPAGPYTCHLTKGVHRLFYIVHHTDLLFREETAELADSLAPIAAVRAQLPRHASTESISQNDGSFGLIFEFLKNPQQDYLRRSVQIKTMAYELIFISHRSLNELEEPKKVSAAWARDIQVYIEDCIHKGHHIDTDVLIKKYRMSRSTLRTIIKSATGANIAAIILTLKLDYSLELLKSGHTVKQTAYYLGMSYSNFALKFKSRFGITPGEHQKNIEQ